MINPYDSNTWPIGREEDKKTQDKLDELLKLAEQNTKEHREIVKSMKEYLETMQQIVKEMK